jgi:hypothetical protein
MAEETRERQSENRLTTELVDREICRLIEADPRQFYRDDGTLKAPSEWSDTLAATVASLDTESDSEGRTRYKLRRWDKVRAIEMAGRRLGLFKDSLDITLHLNLSSRLDRARARLASPSAESRPGPSSPGVTEAEQSSAEVESQAIDPTRNTAAALDAAHNRTRNSESEPASAGARRPAKAPTATGKDTRRSGGVRPAPAVKGRTRRSREPGR